MFNKELFHAPTIYSRIPFIDYLENFLQFENGFFVEDSPSFETDTHTIEREKVKELNHELTQPKN
jgi:hypothetical protein